MQNLTKKSLLIIEPSQYSGDFVKEIGHGIPEIDVFDAKNGNNGLEHKGKLPDAILTEFAEITFELLRDMIKLGVNPNNIILLTSDSITELKRDHLKELSEFHISDKNILNKPEDLSVIVDAIKRKLNLV